MRYCERCGAAFRFEKTCPRDRVPVVAGAADPLLGRVLGGRYRILDRIGAGGMGQVYRAAHTRIACVFAVKVVWGDFAYDQAMQTRFLREAEVASCLQSRHIVRVVDFAEEAGSLPYFVMEFLDGPTLYDLIARSGPLPPPRAAAIATRIARGLSHAHERGVVHRDLKPENIVLITEEDEPDIVKILDFGVARMRDEERLTGFGVTVGTPLYMAPEQLTAGELDGRADLYALGIVLYEMLTGSPPFNARGLQELARQHMQQPPPSLRSRLATTDLASLDDVVRRLLAKDRDDRFSSAKEVIDAIQRALAPGAGAHGVPSRRSPVPSAIYGELQSAILQGAPRYNAGDHAGCYALYRSVAERILGAGAGLAAVDARLRTGVARAAVRHSATDSAWEMRYAFDDILSAPAIALGHGALVDELTAYGSIVQGRETQAQFDVVGDYQIAFARALAARLRSDASYAQQVVALDDAAKRAAEAGGGQQAVHVLDPLFARLRSGSLAPLSAPTRPSLPPLSTSFAVSEGVRHALVRAIRAGAPVYDAGQPDVCERIYRQVASDLVAQAVDGDPVSTTLRRALNDASGRPADEAAWVFRRAFDALLATS